MAVTNSLAPPTWLFLTRDAAGARTIYLRAVVEEEAEAVALLVVMREVVAPIQILSSIKQDPYYF